MTRPPLALFFSAFVLMAGCTTPQAAPPPSPQAANTVGSPSHLICATVEVTGTRLSKRECHTAEDWAALRAQGLEDFQMQAARKLPSGGENAPMGQR